MITRMLRFKYDFIACELMVKVLDILQYNVFTYFKNRHRYHGCNAVYPNTNWYFHHHTMLQLTTGSKIHQCLIVSN